MYKKFYRAIAAAVAFAFIAFTLLLAPIFYENKSLANADGVAEIAMELESGFIFHQKNADALLPMASTTKIMTALIACEELDFKRVVEVPPAAVGIEGSSIYLKKGERLSVKDLVYGLMLRSGNDAACALAIISCGSVNNFVKKMNERAAQMDCKNTNFCNPHGLPCDGHRTTARELCIISCEAMKNPLFKEVVSTQNYSGDFRSFANKNKILKRLDGANGVKTGYTKEAGRCLVSAAKRGDMQAVCVVLNCHDMYERSQKIIENCFEKYEVVKIDCGEVFREGGVIYKLKEDVRLTVEKGAKISYKINKESSPSSLQSARLEIYNENNLIFSRDLYTI